MNLNVSSSAVKASGIWHATNGYKWIVSHKEITRSKNICFKSIFITSHITEHMSNNGFTEFIPHEDYNDFFLRRTICHVYQNNNSVLEV